MRLILNNIILLTRSNIEFTRNSPILTDFRDFTYEISIERNPITDMAFGYVGVPDAAVRSKVYENFIVDDEAYQSSGTLALRCVENGNYKVSFAANTKQGKTLNFKLRDLNHEYNTSDITDIRERNSLMDFVGANIHYPYINDDTSDVGGYQFTKIIDNKEVHEYPKIPFFYVRSIIKKVFEQFGYTAKYELDDIIEDFNDLVLFNNYALDYFRLVRASNGWTVKNYQFIDGVLQFDITSRGDEYFPSETFGYFYYNNNDANPWPLHDKILYLELVETKDIPNPNDPEEIIKHGYYKLSKSKIDNIQPASEILASPNYVVIDITNVTRNFPDTFNIKNHVPNVTFGEFKKALEDKLFLRFVFDDTINTCRIIKLKNVICSQDCISISKYWASGKSLSLPENKGYYIGSESDSSDRYYSDTVRDKEERHVPKASVSNVASLPVSAVHNEFRYVIDEKAYYEYIANAWMERFQSGDQGSWQFFSYKINQEPNNTASYKLISKCCQLAPAKIGLKKLDYLNINHIPVHKEYYEKIVGYGGPIYFSDRIDNNDFSSIRIFFHRGYKNLVKDYITPNKAIYLPIFTTTDYDQEGIKLDYANLSLDYHSANSIPNRCGKEWAEWNASHRKDREDIVNWPEHLFFNFDWEKKYELHGDLHLVESIKFSKTPNGKLKFGVTKLAQC